MDFCAAPELLTLHGVFRHHMMRGATLSPLFHQSKTAMTDEFLAIPLTAFDNMTSPQAMAKHSPWEEKKINKLFWRGSGTGEHFHEPDEVKRPGYDWRDSQRNRWHLFANAKEGVAKVWARATTPSRSGSGKGKGKAASVGWEHRTMPKAELNKRFFDAGLVGKPIQCAPAACAAMAEGIEYMPRINPQASHDYKYMFDTDGNGWSSRFHWLLASGSVVVKTTVFPEWMSDWLTPWVHYVVSRARARAEGEQRVAQAGAGAGAGLRERKRSERSGRWTSGHSSPRMAVEIASPSGPHLPQPILLQRR